MVAGAKREFVKLRYFHGGCFQRSLVAMIQLFGLIRDLLHKQNFCPELNVKQLKDKFTSTNSLIVYSSVSRMHSQEFLGYSDLESKIY